MSLGQTAQRPRTRTSPTPAHWGYDLLRDPQELLALVAALEQPPDLRLGRSAALRAARLRVAGDRALGWGSYFARLWCELR
jgi:hypothetical protein